MEIILLEHIKGLGFMGDIVKVKPGYARNYLMPLKKAVRATKNNIADFENKKKQLEAKNLELRSEANTIAKKIKDLFVIIIRNASENGKLYGSVTKKDIAESITKAGFTITHHQVNIETPIKMLGIHQVNIYLHPEVDVTIDVNVALSEQEAVLNSQNENKKENPEKELKENQSSTKDKENDKKGLESKQSKESKE